MRAYRAVLVLAAACVVSLTLAMGPPPGPKNIALCPVTGKNMTITADTPVVEFKNGQVLYFSSSEAAEKYRKQPRDYWLAPHDVPLPGYDGKRGLPDLRGEIRHCPYSNETMTIDMPTPRVIHKHGQNLYFCCYGCLTSFWTDPASAIV